MMLIEQIRQDQLQARKDRAAFAPVLTTLLGEAVMIGKSAGNRETTDDEVIAVIQKFIKNARETIATLNTGKYQADTWGSNKTKELTLEVDVLSKYLPKQLSSEQLLEIFNAQFASGVEKTPKSKGVLMKFLKDNYANQYDGKEAAVVIDVALKS
jgi:uncharacterized protein YqeY